MLTLFGRQILKLPLLDAVIRESMRLLPPVPLQVRKTMRDTQISGVAVKARTRVILSPSLTGRMPDLYADADRFQPERWATTRPSQYENTAFSAGPRTCIGAAFALAFLKIAIAGILRRYRWTIAPGARIDQRVAIAMWPSRGIPVTFREQDGRFSASPIRGNITRLARF